MYISPSRVVKMIPLHTALMAVACSNDNSPVVASMSNIRSHIKAKAFVTKTYNAASIMHDRFAEKFKTSECPGDMIMMNFYGEIMIRFGDVLDSLGGAL